MKRIISIVLVTLSTLTVMGQEKVTIKPSGNIITKEVSVKPFDGIHAKGLYELILSQGDKESVKIEADDNLQYLFDVSNDGNTLVIDMPKLNDQHINIDNKSEHESLRLKVYVTFKKLTSLDVGVIGNVRSATALKFDALDLDSKNVGNVKLELTANKLNIHNKGVGNMVLSGKATDATVANKGVGEFDGGDLLVQTMDIDNAGVGSADVNVEKDIKIKESFLGKVRNKGAAKTHKMDGVVI